MTRNWFVRALLTALTAWMLVLTLVQKEVTEVQGMQTQLLKGHEADIINLQHVVAGNPIHVEIPKRHITPATPRPLLYPTLAQNKHDMEELHREF